MIQKSSGKIAEDFYAIGDERLPAFLLIGENPTLFDAGMDFMGPRYFEDLKSLLGEPGRLRYLFLTHSHFDHSGAAPYLKRKIPQLKIGASAKAAETLQKPSVAQFIRDLSRKAEKNFSSLIDPAEDYFFQNFAVDLRLDDGQTLDLGGGKTVRVIATPGHTRDALSFYLPHLKGLIAGEAVGVYDRQGQIQPEFLSSYDDYVASLKKLAALDIEILMMSHLHVVTGVEARTHLARSLEATFAFRKRIEEALKRWGGDPEAVVREIYHEDYEVKKVSIQDPEPYRINLTAKVKAIAQNP